MADPAPSILARTARGAFWVVGWRLATRLLGLVNTLILVRLLGPEDFGLIALATTFAIALDICLAIGVEEQIIRAPSPSRALYDTGFTLNLLRGLLVGALVALAAAPAAEFFGDARLEPVLLALAVSAAISGLASIGVADFRRNLQFEREFALYIYPRFASIVVAIGMAFLVRSHWALVAGIFVNRLGILGMGYAMHPWRPRLTLSAWRELAGISAWSWLLNLAITAKDRSESLVIGRLMGTTPVGHYAVGAELATLPTTELIDPICRACMPGFAASRRGEGASPAEDYLRIMALLALLTLPAGLGISAVAGPVVALGFGQAWLEAVPVVAVLGLAGILTSFGNVSAAMLNAHARLATLVAIVVAAGVLRLGLLLVLVPAMGLPGAAIAVGLALLAEHVALLLRGLGLVGLGLAPLLARLWRPAAAAALMALLLWQAGLGWAPPPGAAGQAVAPLLAAMALGAGGYLAALSLFWAVSGRPAGAERDLFGLLWRLLGRLPLLRRLPVLRQATEASR
ncbi:oligosaccharide flippase family protein [Falsiroseomonas selenitidurans]|uniref:Oligosaccharide flippase family protein n=1 Tax=Falsiroseomonas selenitidurans TaxID=2716335 RepID=A0ABX1E6I7_9PROT|nr:oligosaccharide flippase family protein [Falsiroseomonas selenitidurans]NKC30550.1 oligosaccharide flippase family protein [Falsiroseomonas selenitidurans]